MKVSTGQIAVVAGVMLAMTALSFINAGVFAFIAALLAWLAGAGLGVIVGAEGGRRDSAARVTHLETAYADAHEAAHNAIVAQAETAARLARAEERLRQVDDERLQLRAQLDAEQAVQP
ncbi:hypothetical protein AB0392_48915 [Nonomuraea angiospora]|uniref:hypothetical protein n=1 Tax=Nonomuraea angiospora TaxID=46172 RepID=UPI003450D994